jgi:hypothetical protein
MVRTVFTVIWGSKLRFSGKAEKFAKLFAQLERPPDWPISDQNYNFWVAELLLESESLYHNGMRGAR